MCGTDKSNRVAMHACGEKRGVELRNIVPQYERRRGVAEWRVAQEALIGQPDSPFGNFQKLPNFSNKLNAVLI